LAQLHLPPFVHQSALASTSFVPLPKRVQSNPQHQIALSIREGRKIAQKLTRLTETEMSRGSASSKEEDFSGTTGTENMTSLSTVLEQDFTVEGRKGQLECPFSPKQEDEPASSETAAEGAVEPQAEDPTPHHSTDHICAAMFEETLSMPAPAAADASAKCPIRFMDKHSPDEIAHYVETHKHELPRSHEVCIRRYQKNEEHIRKLDAKYGSLVNMIQDLSHLHKPMMPDGTGQGEHDPEADRASTKRVENWANGVSASEAEDPESPEPERPLDEADDRQSHFDRPLRDVRVGESPSRPWGISVPIYGATGARSDDHPRAESPPPAPVHMPNPNTTSAPEAEEATPAPRKCPFDHTKMTAFASSFTHAEQSPTHHPAAETKDPAAENPYGTPVKNQGLPPASSFRPTFINPPPAEPKKDDTAAGTPPPPQMVFNISGPVFIGYPMEQAMQLMQAYQGGR
jgi:hypothetical protein